MADASARTYSDDLALLIEAARQAAPLALRDFRLGADAAAESWRKSHDDSIVTAADHAVNDALRETLRDARPDYGWLSEEDADDPARRAAERLFIVDPIDGTRSFAEGRPEWCLSLAVAEAGRVVAAVVFAPALDRLFAAERDRGAALNEAPIQVAPRSAIDGARILGTRNIRREEHWDGPAPALETFYVQPIAYRLCLVAEGAYDGLISLRGTNEWDVAAGALLVAEAGGAVSGLAGEAYAFNSETARVSGALAAGPRLHAEIRRRLKPQTA